MTASSCPVEILLVEDSPTDRLFATEALRHGPIPKLVRTVENGVDALAYLRQEGAFAKARRPNLILLDLNLPRKDGREVLEEIKADPSLKLIPVVILSTSRAEEDLLLAYAGKASSYLVKPLDFVRFDEMVRTLEQYWLSVVTLPPDVPSRPISPPAPQRTLGSGEKTAIRVLLIEDSASDAYLIGEALRGLTSPVFAITHITGLPQLREWDGTSFDAVLTDLGLAETQGLETLRCVRATLGFLPILVLTGHDDEELGLAALREGAQDFLAKQNLSGAVLGRALRYAVEKRGIEERLRQSQKMEGLGRLAAGIAHDFNNLLTAIHGQAEILQQAGRGASSEGSLGEILAASERATTLTRHLLTFSRQQVMSWQVLDLAQMVRDLLPLLRRVLGEDIRVALDLGVAVPPVEADAGMVEQAIMNLVVNARDAMPHGGTLVLTMGKAEFTPAEARRHPDGYSGPFIWLRVSDSGVGIPLHLLERIFEPFFTTKEVGKGTGLGLATVHGIMQQHRGWVEVSSRVGAGSTFRLYFPAASRPKSGRAFVASPAAGPAAGETILLVEDEAAVRLVARVLLAGSGYKVLEASSGGEALSIWKDRSDEIQLLLTDMVLPDGLSGTQLAELLRASRPQLKVILTSGFSSELAQGSQLPPRVDFLPKPYHAASLLAAVQAALGRPAQMD